MLGNIKISETDDSFYKLFETCKLHFRTLNDLQPLQNFIIDFFDGRKNVATGVHALALNAIEHGNLEIGYDLKGELLLEDCWQDEVLKRLDMLEYKDRQAELVLTRKDGGIYILITDQGKGFNWQKYLKIDPVRSGSKHGRGIAIANSLSFDKLSYNEAGNQAVAFVSDESLFSWAK